MKWGVQGFLYIQFSRDLSAINNNDETVTVSGETTAAESVNITGGEADAVSVDVEEDAFTYTTCVLEAGEYTVSVVAVSGEDVSEAKPAEVTVVNVAPTVESVENVNGNQLIVTFSEPVDNAAVFGNYALRNVTTGSQVNLTTNSVFAVNAAKTVLTITLDMLL